eukprot:scaffold288267_cov17-Tisochrysis_lutea.AAC.2
MAVMCNPHLAPAFPNNCCHQKLSIWLWLDELENESFISLPMGNLLCHIMQVFELFPSYQCVFGIVLAQGMVACHPACNAILLNGFPFLLCLYASHSMLRLPRNGATERSPQLPV